MLFVDKCPDCGGSRSREWGITLGRNRLHYSQSVCRDCGLVYANPVADAAALDAYYRSEYYEQNWPQLLATDADSLTRMVETQRPEVERLRKHQPGGTLLEVGCGAGGFLRAARDAGFETWGIDTSTSAARHAESALGLTNIFVGPVPDARLPQNFFDVVYAWHVIEHVPDLDAFVAALRSMLKPGGLLWVGTETYQNASHYIDRISRWVRFLPQSFSTSDEHTIVFTRRTLSRSLERRGFRVIECEAFQPTLEEKMKSMRFRNPLSRGYFTLQHALNAAFSTGPLLRLAARRVDT